MGPYVLRALSYLCVSDAVALATIPVFPGLLIYLVPATIRGLRKDDRTFMFYINSECMDLPHVWSKEVEAFYCGDFVQDGILAYVFIGFYMDMRVGHV